MTYCGSVEGVGDDLYCCTYYYPNGANNIYNKIFFMTADKTKKVGGETGLDFTHNASNPPLYNSSGFVNNINVAPDDEKTIDVYLNYTDRVIGEAGTQDNYKRSSYQRKITIPLVNNDRTLKNMALS